MPEANVSAEAAMGVHLLDYLQFEDLRVECARAARWEFLFAAAPLRILGGTGSPLNPIAIFDVGRPADRDRRHGRVSVLGASR